jgi:hypothetical protein
LFSKDSSSHGKKGAGVMLLQLFRRVSWSCLASDGSDNHRRDQNPDAQAEKEALCEARPTAPAGLSRRGSELVELYVDARLGCVAFSDERCWLVGCRLCSVHRAGKMVYHHLRRAWAWLKEIKFDVCALVHICSFAHWLPHLAR